MVRAGNGWKIECMENGRVTSLGDWDLRMVVEQKLLNAIIKASGN